MSIWGIRIFFLVLCALGGYAVSQVRPEMIGDGSLGVIIGFGFGGLMVAIDEMLRGFSLRTFSSVTFGLLLGSIIAMLLDRSGLFQWADEREMWLIRLAMFLGFGYIGILLALRSNKEDFSLIIPYVRFTRQNQPEDLLLLDTSVIIDGRILAVLELGLIDGVVVVPRFVLRELQQLADSADRSKRERGRRGLEMLNQLQRSENTPVKIHEAEVPEETETDAKLIRLARALNAKLFTNDYNLARVAELQSVRLVSITELAKALKGTVLPGDVVELKIVREGREKGQGAGYLQDGTLVVVNDAMRLVGQTVTVEVANQVQTGAGVIYFAELKNP
ncbi:MAG TPA: twitching motility protein PilT [Verrucomicrobiales bacterium]|nr:twitching motility protein PilT [Verrucomicrobiales bacterium]